MSPDQARTELTPPRIRDTIIVLEALDCLQAHAWETRFEAQVRARLPHGESTLISMANKAAEDYVHSALPGNAQGLSMNVNTFIKGLKIAGLEEATTIAIAACSHPDLSL